MCCPFVIVPSQMKIMVLLHILIRSQSCVPADFLNNTRAIDCFLERLLDREMANEVS